MMKFSIEPLKIIVGCKSECLPHFSIAMVGKGVIVDIAYRLLSENFITGCRKMKLDVRKHAKLKLPILNGTS